MPSIHFAFTFVPSLTKVSGDLQLLEIAGHAITDAEKNRSGTFSAPCTYGSPCRPTFSSYHDKSD